VRVEEDMQEPLQSNIKVVERGFQIKEYSNL
jgi:hypothetical protein